MTLNHHRIITSLFMLFISGTLCASEITKFTNTSPKTVIRTYYSESQMKGKKNVEIYTNFDRPYQVYLSGLISTRIDLPYAIVNIINSSPKIVGSTKNGKTLVLTLQEQRFEGVGPNIHVILDNGKSILINTEVLPRDQSHSANEIITFIDSSAADTSLEKDSKDYYKHELNASKAQLFKLENYIQNLLNKKIFRVDINETIAINAHKTSITLLTITKLESLYLFHLRLQGDLVDITLENTILEYKPIEKTLAQELLDIASTKDKLSEKPFEIYGYQSQSDYQKEFTLYFNITQPEDIFYFNLIIWPYFQFNNNQGVINMNSYEISDTIFEDF